MYIKIISMDFWFHACLLVFICDRISALITKNLPLPNLSSAATDQQAKTCDWGNNVLHSPLIFTLFTDMSWRLSFLGKVSQTDATFSQEEESTQEGKLLILKLFSRTPDLLERRTDSRTIHPARVEVRNPFAFYSSMTLGKSLTFFHYWEEQTLTPYWICFFCFNLCLHYFCSLKG